MANTKKQNKNKVEQAANISSSSASLNYTGKVSVKFCKGNKVLKSKTYSNNGCGPLFKFIAQCLQGEYRQAEKLRPNKIKLFSNTSEEVKLSWNETTKAVTGFVTSNSPADIDVIKNGSEIIGYKTILHFLVPAVYVDSSKFNDDKQKFGITQLCLYSTKETDDAKCSAYFLFTNKETDDAGNEVEVWDGLSTNDTDENVNLLIDWEMSIKNNGGN